MNTISPEKRKSNYVSLFMSDSDLSTLESLMESYGAESRSQALRRLIRQAGAGQGESVYNSAR